MFTAFAVIASHASAQRVQIQDVTVQAVMRAECQSGYVSCWDRITVLTTDQIPVDVFSLNMTGLEWRPAVGQACRITCHYRTIAGSVVDGVPGAGPWNVLDDLDCSTRRLT